MKSLLVFYGIRNAVLYSSLVPLWEGFGEPFHYGYVESLSVEGRLPVLNQTALSDEIWSSLKLAPVSHVVRRNLLAPPLRCMKTPDPERLRSRRRRFRRVSLPKRTS